MPGLEPLGRAAALEAVLNPTQTTYVGLLAGLPTDGGGEVEVAPTGYSRVLSQSWITEQASGSTRRSSTAVIAFGPYPEEIKAKGWAIWDAPAGGNLIASGMFFDTGGGQAGVVTVPSGEDVQFQPGLFSIILSGDCPVIFGGAVSSCPSVVEVRIYDNTTAGSPALLATKAPGAGPHSLGAGGGTPILVEIQLDIAINPADWSFDYDGGSAPDAPLASSYASQVYTLEYVHPTPGGAFPNIVAVAFEQAAGLDGCSFSEALTSAVSS